MDIESVTWMCNNTVICVWITVFVPYNAGIIRCQVWCSIWLLRKLQCRQYGWVKALLRQDIRRSYPDWLNSRISGFQTLSQLWDSEISVSTWCFLGTLSQLRVKVTRWETTQRQTLVGHHCWLARWLWNIPPQLSTQYHLSNAIGYCRCLASSCRLYVTINHKHCFITGGDCFVFVCFFTFYCDVWPPAKLNIIIKKMNQDICPECLTSSQELPSVAPCTADPHALVVEHFEIVKYVQSWNWTALLFIVRQVPQHTINWWNLVIGTVTVK